MNSYQTQSEFFLEFNQFCDFQLWWKTSWWKTRQFEDLMHLIFTFLTEFVAGCLARGIFLYFLVANSSKYLTPSNFACFCNNPPPCLVGCYCTLQNSLQCHFGQGILFSSVIPPNLSCCIVVRIKWLRKVAIHSQWTLRMQAFFALTHWCVLCVCFRR